ncbi:M48 family metallopeptidase [Gilvibacter sediminis]|uniref:M48 family metallopeptidase n=1 Tax=Gilvibacter sediminis TaxID=379071 RepID=UPI0023504A76|nr:M48 family metallopeptidase [Gilvibacter sediminis]MDC7997732.1 M48 family metallopeptidase [Gilvibacter sediminis]
MDSFYSQGPKNVPEGYTNPTQSFKKHVFLSILGLLLFIVLYLGLTFWFGRLAYYSFMNGDDLWSYVLAGGYAFICLFLIKSLFFLNKKVENPMQRFVTKEEEPVLFDYIYKLADEAKAPRPHKVFLTHRVNASVSYDLSLINLIIPSKKNLEIGLGLTNVLSLGEFKAVLAHEFGHFAQRSMLLGRYVYVAQQIAARIVGKRDAFDKFLGMISSIDIRVAWIGWILSILVWAVRSLIETCFSVVVIAERALSREMEFQADLVAVSLTGSDALIHALHRLQVADEAFNNAMSFVNVQLAQSKTISNMYTVQSQYIKNMKQVLDDPLYGESPVVDTMDPAKHRVFTSRAYNPPQMWSTHPVDKDREDNAKRAYLASDIDNRKAEILFNDATALEEEMTKRLIATSNAKDLEMLTEAQTLEAFQKEYFDWTFLEPKYASNFMNRYPFLNFDSVDDIFDAQGESLDLNKIKDKLYSDTLKQQLDQYQELQEEIQALEISKHEVIIIEKRAIWHRGEQIKRKDIDDVLRAVQAEKKELVNALRTHDKQCRMYHYQMAQQLGGHWDQNLKTLTHLIHYAEHAVADLNDSERKFNNTVSVAIADGRVSSEEFSKIHAAANDYYKCFKAAYHDSTKIELEPALVQAMKADSYEALYEEFKLGFPDRENMDRWINAATGWAAGARQNLQLLRNLALERLLDVEAMIADAYWNKKSLPQASLANKMIPEYATLPPGKERKIQRKLSLWDRFMLGEGLFGAASKFAASVVLIGGALFLGSSTTGTDLLVYNGLGIPVTVESAGQEVTIGAHDYESLDVSYNTDYQLTVSDPRGNLIESYTAQIGAPGRGYVYNVAGAALFVKYAVFYGYDGDAEPDYLGSPRLVNTKVDYLLQEPPSSIELSSSSRGARKSALAALSNLDAYDLVNQIEDSLQLKDLIFAHAQWENPSDAQLVNWLNMSTQYEDADTMLSARMNNYGEDVPTLRAMMIQTDEAGRLAFCEEIGRKYEQDPENPDYLYMNIRCMEDDLAKNARYTEAHTTHPDHPWLGYAAGYVYGQNERWEEALMAFETAGKEEALATLIAEDATRILRLLDIRSDFNSYEFRTYSSSDLDFYGQLESGDVDGARANPNYAYHLIHIGDLEGAFSMAMDNPVFKPYLLRQIAASDGATEAMISEALSLDTEIGLTGDTAWSAIGLAINNGDAYEEFLPFVAQVGVDPADLENFIDALKAKNTAAMEANIKQREIYQKGYFYSLACMVLKDKTPMAWRKRGNALLFPTERQYINLNP